jgi:hypothetical protein
MRRYLLRSGTVLALTVMLASMAVPAFAAGLPGTGLDSATHVAQEGGNGPAVDVVPGSIWTVVGVAAGGLVLGIFYLLKRRVGGFPANPDWVAPITIMPSKDSPDEGTFGDVAPDAHGHH